MALKHNLIKQECGSIYAHLFENTSTGLNRNLFWNLNITFKDIDYLGEKWNSSLAIEWMTLQTDNIVFPYTVSFDSSDYPDIEASFYLGEHHVIDNWKCTLRFTSDYNIESDYSVLFDFPGLDNDPVHGINISDSIKLEFDGVMVIKDNLFPKPSSPDDARNMVTQFLDINDWHEISKEEWKYIFKPPNRKE